MTYTDRDGKTKHWTQAELAVRLGLKEVMVNLMENKNQGLDSMERRRTLSTILRIPPALLGLGSLDLIVEVATGQKPIGKTSAKKIRIGRDTIKQYQAMYKVYETLFVGGLSYASAQDIDKWARRIEQDVENVDAENKTMLLRILWDFEILCAKVYSSDLANWPKTFEHIDNALELATMLGDRDLQAASLYTSGVHRFRQGRIGLARVAIDGALMYARDALPQTKGAIYSGDAFLRAKDTSIAETTIAQRMYDTAEKYAGIKSEVKTVKFGKGLYYLGRAGTLLDMKRPAKALEFIDMAEEHINPAKKRLIIYLNILRARSYLALHKPEYEQAVKLLSEALEESEELRVQRHVHHIEQLYTKLVASSYGNSPDVASLGFVLQELKQAK
ncbi:MAG TPA: hypothetical protein VFV38_06505 [Ktedonobacteraceae bacterium]|nr:hypothetical protein [Ktedonobacteraceae bacterium]